MKKTLILMVAIVAAGMLSARSFDGTENIYLKANAVSWWTNDNCVQRAVLDNATSVIGTVEDADRKIYAFTVPAGDYTTIRFERCQTAEAAAWNATGEITIPAEGNYVTAFDQNSTTATWETFSGTAPAVYTTHHIYITNNTDWEQFYVYAWGDSEAFGAWPGSTATTLDFQAADGAVTLHLIIHNNIGEGQAGDKRINIDITEARDYYITVPEPAAEVTSAIKVLSINNSLIDRNDQNIMFNSMSETMGKDATWTKHTNLGQSLAYHYNTDPLTPDAQTVVASVGWTHIILQEQSSLPRTDLAAFYSNVQTWVNYIHANCPNANVQIILPINWAYSDDADFVTNNATLIANYEAVADDFNIALCPVAIAYGNYRLDYPSSFVADLYTDNRHPSVAASYLACCLEYATIFSENPSTITWKPAELTDEMAQRMRTYAQEAYEGTIRTEPTEQPATEALLLTGATPHTEDFNSLGGADVDPSTDAKTGILRASALPQGWRIERNTNAPRQLGTFAAAADTTMYIGGQSLASNAYNGTWNFGATGSSDRAIGGLTTGVANGTRGINVMVHLHNSSTSDFADFTLTYDIEKYRNGSNAAGFTVQLYTSVDGVTWTSAGDDFKTTYAADANNNGFATVPASTTAVSHNLPIALNRNADLYLAWNISVSSGTSCNAAPGLAIDNVSITPNAAQGSTAVERVNGEQPDGEWTKELRDGQLLIRCGDRLYDLRGNSIR